jgi:exodeoxyribonuclease V beta subunit
VSAHATSRPLDLHSVPLAGTQVIEASAGTGKTRTITGLFVRVVIETGTPVEQILVVTYTVAATKELRERIRKLLVGVRAALRGEACTGELAAELTGAVTDRATAERRVARALTDFDLAAIHTIHGFCQRALREHALATGLPFTSELVADVGDLLQEAVDDFWRRRVTGESWLLVQHLLDQRMSPDSLAAAIAPHLGWPDLRLAHPPAAVTDTTSAPLLAAWQGLRAAWPDARTAVEALLSDPGIKKNSFKPAAVGLLLRRIDVALCAGLPELRTVEELFRRLDPARVAGAWKQGAAPRTHPVLATVGALLAAAAAARGEVEGNLRALRTDLLPEVRHGLATRKRRARVQSFDDLLLALRQALDQVHGAALAARLRARWRVALVDEFQDTDPVQHDIVRRIWIDAGGTVFLVGDPKQAIYRFRGADVYAYLAARDAADARHDLVRNWRAGPDLVGAVNALFGRAPRPFLLDGIPFPPAEAARAGPSLVVAGDPAEPFRIWFLERDDDGKMLAKSTAARRVAEATAAEIARLLRLAAAGKARLPAPAGGTVPLEGGDIAVLVRTHHHGRMVAAALARRRVASVQEAEDSVFASREAEQLRRVLLAVAEPGRDALLRAALGTELFAVSGEALVALLDDDRAWTAWVDAFHRHHERWRSHGFGVMFRELLAEHGVPGRLLEYDDGERRLTNLLHLAELLQDEATRRPRGLEGLVQWMVARAADARPEKEEQQLRLESDEHVVKIVTVHKSKGLQYPVVFCPFVWDGRLFSYDPRWARDVVCHDPTAGDQATLELDAARDSPLRDQACREELAEQLRLFYVAVTRAVHRCTIAWGATGDSHTAAPFWLLHAAAGDDTVAALSVARARMRDVDLRADLDALAARSGGTIRIETLPEGRGGPARVEPEQGRLLTARRVPRPVTWSWRMASFSGLMADRAEEGPDHDAVRMPPPVEDEAGARTLAAFPRGARAGRCLHAILERTDFTATGAVRRELVGGELQRFGFEATWTPVIDDMVARVVATPLDAAGQLRLAAVPLADRLDELEFTYPVARFDVAGLQSLLRSHGFGGGAFDASIDGLAFADVAGFMRGFIDLVFAGAGRYWLVDWKSNWLGPAPEDYAADRLPAVMAREAYWLQYLIYTVVLHRLLRLRQPGYDYDRHVGGVFYLFLRGMTPERGSAAGVFHDRPTRALVEALDAWIGSAP